MTDFQLIEAISKDDEKAFKVLFTNYYKSLISYITTFTNDVYLSEDIVQQAFIALWVKRRKLKIVKSPKSYLHKMTYNTYIDYTRKKKSESVFFNDLKEAALRESIVEDKDILEKRLIKLKSIIDSLPPRCKEIFELNKLGGGLKYTEIATKLNISIKTVEAQMGIAFQKIRKGFEKDKSFLFFLQKELD